MRAAVVALAGFLSLRGGSNDFTGVAHVGFDFTPAQWLTLHVNGRAYDDSVGLVEAHVTARKEFGLDHVQVRAGQFFLPTSRENKDELWASPYTISFSSLNSWIAEEVRPIGVDLEYRRHPITVGATAFRGNDTMGTLLAWRGWATHDRIATYDEVLPLPPLAHFAFQKDGTTPFTNDLDGRTGYSARVRWSLPERGNVQYTFVDNRGDRELYGDEYAWATRYHQLGGEVGSANFTLAAELMDGKTGMGGRFPAFVDADFYAGYVLMSYKRNRQRFSGRYEIFATHERDFSIAESNEEHGRAWTFTYMFDLREDTRLAAEFTQVTGERAESGSLHARTFTVEARYRW